MRIDAGEVDIQFLAAAANKSFPDEVLRQFTIAPVAFKQAHQGRCGQYFTDSSGNTGRGQAFLPHVGLPTSRVLLFPGNSPRAMPRTGW